MSSRAGFLKRGHKQKPLLKTFFGTKMKKSETLEIDDLFLVLTSLLEQP